MIKIIKMNIMCKEWYEKYEYGILKHEDHLLNFLLKWAPLWKNNYNKIVLHRIFFRKSDGFENPNSFPGQLVCSPHAKKILLAAHNAMDLFLSQQSAQPTLLDHPTTQ
jgi:hypothetical protein